MTDQIPTTVPVAAAVAASPPPRRLFTATLILGKPGSGKTSLLKTYADYLWEVHKKILLLYSWDGGAIPTDVQKGMKQGIIRFWRARTRSAEGLGIETLYLAARGYWPRLINAETGETSPTVQLVPPVTVKYKVSCPNGHLLLSVPSPALIVPTYCQPCASFIAQHDMRVEEELKRTKGFEMVGGVAFDGLTSMTDVVMDHMDRQRGAGNIGGEKPAFGGVVVSGNEKFGGNNRADVGFGQTRARQLVNASLGIPYLVEGPVFTALTMEATDEGGLPIIGPKLPGRAATDEGSAWFGNVMETGKETDDKNEEHFVLYLRPFTDVQGRSHLLKTSSSPFGVPDKLVDPPTSAKQPFTQVNLGLVFKTLDEDLRRSLLQELPGAPGIPTEMMEYGEATMVETAAGAVPSAPIAGQPLIPVMGAGPRFIAPAVVAPAPQGMPAAPLPAAPPIPAQPTVAPASPAAAVASPAVGTPAGPVMLVPAKPARASRRAAPAKPNGAGADGSTQPVPAAPLVQPPPPPPTPPPPPVAVAPPTVAAVPQLPLAGPVQAPPAMHPRSSAPPVMLPTSGTAPPPPPGMRPPMKAPGS